MVDFKKKDIPIESGMPIKNCSKCNYSYIVGHIECVKCNEPYQFSDNDNDIKWPEGFNKYEWGIL